MVQLPGRAALELDQRDLDHAFPAPRNATRQERSGVYDRKHNRFEHPGRPFPQTLSQIEGGRGSGPTSGRAARELDHQDLDHCFLAPRNATRQERS